MAENSKKKTAQESETENEIEKILATARADAEKIIEDAKKEAEKIKAGTGGGPSDEEKSQKEKADRAANEELVEITLFKDSSKYTDDVFVSVNEENCLIQRGKPVKIKRKFYKVLMNSQAQDVAAAEKSSALSDSFEEKTKKYE